MADKTGWINIDGHLVDPDHAEQFFDGETGRPLTDEEWDESKRRRQEQLSDDDIEWDDEGKAA